MSVADRGNAEASGAQLIAMSRFGEARFRQAGFSSYYVPHGLDFDVWKPLPDKAGLGLELNWPRIRVSSGHISGLETAHVTSISAISDVPQQFR